MVIKRTCSFCAGEIEPGTGMMFVKRDGTAYFFCSHVCRRDLLVWGRVGHRFKWTRAYQSKKALEMSQAVATESQAKSTSKPKGTTGTQPATPPSGSGTVEKVKEEAPATTTKEPEKSKAVAPKPAAAPKPVKASADSPKTPAKPAKK